MYNNVYFVVSKIILILMTKQVSSYIFIISSTNFQRKCIHRKQKEDGAGNQRWQGNGRSWSSHAHCCCYVHLAAIFVLHPPCCLISCPCGGSWCRSSWSTCTPQWSGIRNLRAC